jgi:hypothetical protein
LRQKECHKPSCFSFRLKNIIIVSELYKKVISSRFLRVFSLWILKSWRSRLWYINSIDKYWYTYKCTGKGICPYINLYRWAVSAENTWISDVS